MSIHFIIILITAFLCALLAMAFFTLLERKILGYIQLRKGPNKVSIRGIPQPIADALKLFSKEINSPLTANISPFLFIPILALFLALIIWILFPYKRNTCLIYWGIIIFLCLSRINVYPTLFSGWASNSKYSLLGALRRVAQTISYEVRIALVIITPIIIITSLSLNTFASSNSMIFSIILWPLFVAWIITSLAETNRTPFDLAEGESELVSGFNTEYRSGRFALIFIAEYINILAMGIVSSSIFLITSLASPIFDIWIITALVSVRTIFIWARGTYPRIRYDKLIRLTWKLFLPITLVVVSLTTILSIWCCAGRTDNPDVVNYETLSSILSSEACNSNEFLLH